MINKDSVLKDNPFSTLTLEELEPLWNGYLKAVYNIGWYEEDNPLKPYIKKAGKLGVMKTENNLLTAIAFKSFENS